MRDRIVGGGMCSWRLDNRLVDDVNLYDKIVGGIADGIIGKGLGMGTTMTLHEDDICTGTVARDSGEGVGTESNV